MAKTERQPRKIQNGKELLEDCRKKLKEGQSGLMGKNVALYPTVIVLMGDKCSQYGSYIKDTLDENWQNARYLHYLHVYKSGDSWHAVELENVQDRDNFEWKEEDSSEEGGSNDFQSVLDNAVQAMLEVEEKYIKDRNFVKLEFVLDTADENGKEFYDLYKRVELATIISPLKTLYMMVDQSARDGKNARSDELVRFMAADPEKTGTIYLISNQKDNGVSIGDRELGENFRLVANITLLGGNNSKTKYSNQNIYNGVKTVSYALVTKPTEEIADVSLSALLKDMYAEEIKHSKRELTIGTIRTILSGKEEPDKNNGFDFAEQVFHTVIAPQFPKPEAFEYLPFFDLKDRAEDIKEGNVKMKVLEQHTGNAIHAFIDLHYVTPAIKYLRDYHKECEEQIERILMSRFSLFDLQKIAEEDLREDVKRIILAEYEYSNIGQGDFCRSLHHKAIYQAKKTFYAEIKKIMWETMERLLENAEAFVKLYQMVEYEVGQEQVFTGEESESVKLMYERLVEDFVQDKQIINSKESAFPAVFNVMNTKEDLLEGVRGVFRELIKHKVYGYDFEKEVEERMDNMNATQRYTFVTTELQQRGSVRLKNAVDLQPQKVACYYMINDGAEYAKALRESENNDRDYTLFSLNRTDSIEQIEIYNINRLDQLRLIKLKEDGQS